MSASPHIGDSNEVKEPEESSRRNADASADLLSALSGLEANRERAVAHRARRMVMSSLGVIKEEQHDRSRARAVAVAVSFVLVLLITPLMWEAADSFFGGEHLGEVGGQLSLWACILCPTLLGAALIAGWWRKRT